MKFSSLLSVFLCAPPLLLLWPSRVSIAADDDLDFFERKIRPVLVQHCYSCHSADNDVAHGGLRLDSREAILRGGDSGPAIDRHDGTQSLLLGALKYESLEMPPDGPLGEQVVADFQLWIERGARDPRHEAELEGGEMRVGKIDYDTGRQFWAFAPLDDAPTPVLPEHWGQGAIDAWVYRQMQPHALRPSPPASPQTLVRRLYFDLIGLPPTAEQVALFARDDSPVAYQRLVDRLLHAPEFGERWARPWLDLARFAEDQAHIVGNDRSLCFPNAFLYRDWVIAALNDDLPYDQFIRLQLAADLVAPDQPQHLAALGFMGLGPKYYRRGSPEVMADEWEDRVDVLTRGLLGLTVACARCHDHKFDPIGTEDYYALAGVFASSEMFNRPLDENAEKRPNGQAKSPDDAMHIVRDANPRDLEVMIRGDVNRKGATVPRRFVTVLSPPEPKPFSSGSGRAELADAMLGRGQPLAARVAVNRIWGLLIGQPLVATTSNFGTLGATPTHPELLDALAASLIDGNWSIKRVVRQIVLSDAYRQASRESTSQRESDPENRWLSRMNRKRLPLEAWRDAVLHACGTLEQAIGGPSMDPGDPHNGRRTVYSEVSRLDLNRFLALFDFPDPNTHSDGRNSTINPLQKLFLLNSPFMLSQAASLRNTMDHQTNDLEQQIHRVYQRLFARDPTPVELRMSREFLTAGLESPRSDEAWNDWAQALLASNEFAFID